MSSVTTSDHSAEILARAINPADGNLPEDAARSMLEFQLSPDDLDRVNQLAAKAREGTLSPEERAELDDYERTSAFLELIQSKARQSLKSTGLSS